MSPAPNEDPFGPELLARNVHRRTVRNMTYSGRQAGPVDGSSYKYEALLDSQGVRGVLLSWRGGCYPIESRYRGLVWAGIGYSDRAESLGYFARFGPYGLRVIDRSEPWARHRIADERPDLARFVLQLDLEGDQHRAALALMTSIAPTSTSH